MTAVDDGAQVPTSPASPVDAGLAALSDAVRPQLPPPPARTRSEVPAGLSVVPPAVESDTGPVVARTAGPSTLTRTRTTSRRESKSGSRNPAPTVEASPAQDAAQLHPVSVRIPVELKARLDADLGVEGLTQTERVVQAFNAQAGRIGQLFPEVVSQEGPMPVVRSTRRRRTPAGPSELVRLRLTIAQREVLDEMVERLNTNRTLLVTRVLEEDLPPLG